LNIERAAAPGVLAIYAAEVDAFDESELRLLRELADDLAYGITALRVRAEQLRMAAHLQEADRMVAVGTLAAGVAHEINNPLAYVVAAHGFIKDELELLSRELPPGRLEEVGQALADAREGASRVTTIVRDLKTFSRADEERTGPVDLHRVIDSSSNMAAVELKHRAHLIKEYGRIPLVRGNEARLGQVFLNLLINAAHAIPEGHKDRNDIRVTTSMDDAGRAVVEVRDTGSGIAHDVARHIFDPFFTTKPVGVGTGLGLFICRNIVTAAGGSIAVDSDPGNGTVFRVTLPAAESSADEEQHAPPFHTPHEAIARRGRVLVVDDEPAIGRALRRVLEADHDVVTLTNAIEARDRLARGEHFDVILCDLMMPHMTGMQLHEELTKVAPDQATRMVVLTGGAFTTSARLFLDGSAIPRLMKPIDSAELGEVVRSVMSEAPTPRRT
jgi:two-component system cell cycle sensor histidine kinase/response regulator CckA